MENGNSHDCSQADIGIRHTLTIGRLVRASFSKLTGRTVQLHAAALTQGMIAAAGVDLGV